METATFHVEGMSCASCVAKIENTLRAQSGIVAASVSLANRQAFVTYDIAHITRSHITRTINQMGYRASDLSESVAQAEKNVLDSLQRRFFIALALTLPLMAHMLMPGSFFKNTRWEWVLATLVQGFAGWPFYRGAWAAAKLRAMDMNTLVAIGTSAAYGYSAAATWGWTHSLHDVYYESSAVTLTVILLGRLLEARAMSKTSDALKKLVHLQPQVALRLKENGETETVAIEHLNVGDILLIRPGTSIPVDGTVIEGVSAVDESMISGEAFPVDKKNGDSLTGGTVNQNGRLIMQVRQIGDRTVLAQMVKCVREAQNTKPAIAKLADRIAAVFVPAVMAIAAIAAGVWLALGEESMAIHAAVAVLIVACPCALGLATPVSIIVGMGRAAQSGILIKNADVLEAASRVDTVVFDKTGTLTYGQPSVTQVLGEEASTLLFYAASAEGASEHPLARAIMARAKKAGITPQPPTSFEAKIGKGVVAGVQGKTVHVGTQLFFNEENILPLPLSSPSDATVVYVALDRIPIGAMIFSDPIREDASQSILALRKNKINIVLLTGDRASVAGPIAEKLGITQVIAEAQPTEKMQVIRRLQSDGHHVAMVGEGINDAPALAQAQVGIAMSGGTDIAQSAAPVILMHNHLQAVATLLDVSRETMKNVKQNLFFAFSYNSVLIPIAAGALYPLLGVRLSPWMAGAAMALSSLSVITNALRLKAAAH